MTDRSPMASAVPVDQKRPVAITIICVIGFIGALITVPLIFSATAARVASWYPLLVAASAIVGLACMVGLWMMRRWAVYVYTALAVVTQLILMASGLWNPLSLIIPAIIIVIMFIYLQRMR